MKIDQRRLLDYFLELVQIDAVSLHERPVADYVAEKLRSWKIPFEEDDAGEQLGGKCGNIIARLKGSGEPLLLMAHMDTVSSTKRLNPVITDGLIKSAGDTILGADDRAGMAVILYVLDNMAHEGFAHRDLEVVFSVAEELGMLGCGKLNFSTLKAREGFILDCSRKPGCYVATTPTAIDFKINIFGKAAHAAVHPEAGINAISIATELIRKIPVGRVDEHTVANVGTITGGTATNVIPEHVLITGEIRSFDEKKITSMKQDILRASEIISQKYGGKIEPYFRVSFVGFNLSRDLPVVKQAETQIRKMGLTPKPLTYYGGSDANVMNQHGVVAVNLGVGVTNPHSKNEYIAIDDLLKITELLINMVKAE